MPLIIAEVSSLVVFVLLISKVVSAVETNVWLDEVVISVNGVVEVVVRAVALVFSGDETLCSVNDEEDRL